MSKILSLILTVGLMLSLAPLSAGEASSYADALRRAGEKKPVVIFCYGANYDKYSERVYKEYVKNQRSALFKVLRSEIFVIVPMYQQPTEQEKKEQAKKLGGRGLPGGIWSYPSFTVVDGKGNFRGVVQSSEDMSTPEKAAEKLAKILDDFKEQDKLLDKAERASGSNKKKLMREALNLSDVRVPGHGMCDPANDGLVEALQHMSIPAANNHIRSLINNGNYTKLERQMIFSAYAGHVRRSKGPIPLLRSIYTEMRNIDPKSSYGIYAEGAIELWVVPFEVDDRSKEKPEQPQPAEKKEAE